MAEKTATGQSAPRLFLSVDMVGSTQFKARFTGKDSADWLDTFRTFFTNFPLMLAGQVGFEFLDDEGSTPAVDVWKVMGDEMIFVAQPSSPEEMTAILCALLRTMQLYEDRHYQTLPLRLKGTAWLADFDGQNIEIDIPELSSDDGGQHIDFIGPDIDLGFRLSKYSRPSSLVLSIELVDILLTARNRDMAALYHVGSEELKGVMFGRPYPIFWMHLAEAEFVFFPWETEACALMAKAKTMTPTPESGLQQVIGDMRHYLKKMQGIEQPRMVLGQAKE